MMYLEDERDGSLIKAELDGLLQKTPKGLLEANADLYRITQLEFLHRLRALGVDAFVFRYKTGYVPVANQFFGTPEFRSELDKNGFTEPKHIAIPVRRLGVTGYFTGEYGCWLYTVTEPEL